VNRFSVVNLGILVSRRQKKRIHQQQSAGKRINRLLLGLGATLILLLSTINIALALFYVDITSNLPSLETLPLLLDSPNGLLLKPTQLFDRSGEHVIYTLENPGIKRRFLPIDEKQSAHISPNLVKATLALTDPTYWTNPGYSIQGIKNGSHPTLAQQLVFEVLLANESPGLRRNIRERLLANQIISHYGRNKILEWYLNSAYYGHLAYGAEAAAQLYFGKSAANLNLAEAALLAGLVQTPALNPLDAPQAAYSIQQQVLESMLAQGVITIDEFVDAKTAVINFKQNDQQSAYPYQAFINLVLQQAQNQLGRGQIERGGLQIITTLDYDLQNQMLCTIRTQIARQQGSSEVFKPENQTECIAARYLPTLSSENNTPLQKLAASSIILDTPTGQILALSGNTTTTKESGFSNEHPAGTLITPVIYLTGFTRGLNPASLAWDIPNNIADNDVDLTNPDGKYHGPVRLRVALANDYLMPAIQVMNQIGLQITLKTAEQFGLIQSDSSSENQIYRLLTGEDEISIIDAARFYAIFANQGNLKGQATNTQNSETPVTLNPTTVLRILDFNGRLLVDWSQPESQPLISQQLAYLINNILADETVRWPSLGHPNSLEIGRPVSAKIGQTQQKNDVWTVGYTPRRLVVVWVGNETNTEDKKPVDIRYASGLWNALIKYSTRNLPIENWTAPSGITKVDVCDPSGLLPTAICPAIVNEVFISGNEPTSFDTLFRSFLVNRETNRLATVFTSPEVVEERVYLVIPPEAIEWAQSVQYPIPPDAYDIVQAPPILPNTQITDPVMFTSVRGKVTIKGVATGKDFSFYRLQIGQGLNPKDWIQIGQDSRTPIEKGVLGVWDSAGKSGIYALRLMVVSKDQKVETATTQIMVDNYPPVIEIPYPIENQVIEFTAGTPMILQAKASDDMSLAKLEAYIDGELIGTITQQPFVFLWESAVGDHHYQVRAYDSAGNMSQSKEIKFSVR
jgi:membrane peptidoglycan carboxypeptidase